MRPLPWIWPPLVGSLLAISLGLSIAYASSPAMLAGPVAATCLLLLGSATATRTAELRSRGTTATSLDLLTFLGTFVGTLFITWNGVRLAPSVSLSDGVLLMVGCLAVLSAASGQLPKGVFPSWLLLAGGMLVAAGTLSAGVAESFGPNLVPALQFTAALLVTPLIIGLVARSRRRRELIAQAFVASSFVSALIATIDSVMNTTIGTTFTGADFAFRSTGLATHPDHLGLACALSLPIVLFFVLQNPRSNSHRLLGVAVASGLVTGIVVSLSRAAIIGAVAGLLVSLLVSGDLRRTMTTLVTTALVIITALAAFSLGGSTAPEQTQSRLFGDESSATSDLGRVAALRGGTEAFLERPITGNGFETVLGAHNIYLQLLEAGGVLAFTAFSLFLFGVLREGLRTRRSGAVSARDKALAGALIASTAVWMIYGLAQNSLYDRFLYVPAGLLLGLAAERSRGRTPSLG